MGVAQNCGICHGDPVCTCNDFEKRLDECSHFLYKACTKCNKHYERCVCEEPYFSVRINGEWSDSIAVEERIHRTVR